MFELCDVLDFFMLVECMGGRVHLLVLLDAVNI